MVKYGKPFWERVDKSDECWVWTGALTKFGYGHTSGLPYGEKRPLLTHRVSWLLTHGDIPDGMCVLHRCDNPPCVRPDHLFLGSKKDNTQDMIDKGRGRAGAQPWNSRTLGERNAHAKLTASQVVEMRKRAAAGEHYRDLADAYGISVSNANTIIIGNSWRHVWPFNPDGSGGPERKVRPRKRSA